MCNFYVMYYVEENGKDIELPRDLDNCWDGNENLDGYVLNFLK